MTVWILNESAEDAIVRADAGAGAVLVDTVTAGDSIQVRLESRVDSILLSAVGLRGAQLGREWVDAGTGVERAVFP